MDWYIARHGQISRSFGGNFFSLFSFGVILEFFFFLGVVFGCGIQEAVGGEHAAEARLSQRWARPTGEGVAFISPPPVGGRRTEMPATRLR